MLFRKWCPWVEQQNKSYVNGAVHNRSHVLATEDAAAAVERVVGFRHYPHTIPSHLAVDGVDICHHENAKNLRSYCDDDDCS